MTTRLLNSGRLLLALLGILLAPVVIGADSTDTDIGTALYRTHCASCHGSERLGITGPALLPENLRRLRRAAAIEVIGKGRAATQMPGFDTHLSETEIVVLADYIYAPPTVSPHWDAAAIRASHHLAYASGSLLDQPQFDVEDLLNLFIVVELGDHHATLLDGTTLTPIHRFKTHFALHGGPKFSADGRYVYFASRDGWISKYDIYNLKMVAEIRAGINTRNLAVSADGRTVMVANTLPHTLVALSGDDLSLLKVLPVEDGHGNSSRVSAVYTAAPRNSFIAALKDFKEVWEIPYNDRAEVLPVYTSIVHDYRQESGEAPPIDASQFPVRRIHVDDYLDDFFFDPGYRHLIGAARDSGGGQVINLTVGRQIATVDLPGLPHLGSGISWRFQGREVIATPNLKEGAVSVIDTSNWKTIKRIDTLGPGFFMRSHENSRYAWVDVFFGENKDVVHVIDKQSLEIVKTLRPAPGKTAAHVEFSRNGHYALLSIWEDDGTLVVYDAQTLEEVKRLPMRKPSGKYNIYNKITLSTGTSH